jgi:predicted exporter
MKLFFKIIGFLFIFVGCLINGLGILASMQGPYGIGGVLGGGIFIALGIAVIVMNRKGYAW